jgi:hypothetical protein
LFILFVSLIGWNAVQGGNSTKSIVASQTVTPPRIDGLLSDDVWRSAVPVGGFLQYDPHEGAPPTEETIVRVLYDDRALFIGVLCRDSDPSGIVQQLTRRDRSVQADRFTVIIDSYHDHNSAYVFSGTASGVQTDGILSQDGLVYDVQWDAVWEYSAAIIPEGWSAEFKIPFSALRFSVQDGENVWGINFRRFIARKQETVEWVMVPRSEALLGLVSPVSKQGHLSGLRGLGTPLRMELLPYQVSRLSYVAQPVPFPLRREVQGNIGLDLKYGLTNDLTLDVAINPDFGQVEVDQTVLNLTVFETFYPEKRPFFLEGTPIFTFGNTFDGKQLRLLYSRRLGRNPTGYASLSVPSGYAFREKPAVTTILGATKLSGRIVGGLEVGVLSAVTDREEAVLEDIAGHQTSSIVVEPRSSYNVVRVRQNLHGTSWLGAMGTAAMQEGRYPELSGGVDWNLRLGQGVYAIDGFLAGSSITDALGTHYSGGAGRMALAKLEGVHWLAFSRYDFSTRNFDINKLGYFGEPREHGGDTQISFKEDYAPAPLRRFILSLQTDYRWNWDGAGTVKRVEIEPSMEFRNFWQVTLNFYHNFPAFDDASRGIVGLYRRPRGNRITANLLTDTRQALVFATYSGYENSEKGLRSGFSTMELTIRPTTWMEFTPAFTFSRSRNEEAWMIGYYSTRGNNIFGDRDVDQHDFSMRGTITFTRNFSLQFFSQVFLAKGRYTNLRELVAPDSFLPDPDPLASSQFNQKVLNANVAFRWEYLPGSTLYLVWTQQRQQDGGLYDWTLSRNFSDTFRLPMDNVILLKMSYWWSP